MTKQGRYSIRKHQTALGGAVVVGCLAILFGCGGGGNGPTSPTPRPPVRNVIVEEGFADLPPVDSSEEAFFLHFVTGLAGDLDITVDWTLASNDVDFVLVRGTLEQALSPACQEDADTPECPLQLVATAETFSKPEVLTIANAAAGDYVVAVVNFGTTAESGVIVIGLTTTAPTTSAPAVGAVRSTTASGVGGRMSRHLRRSVSTSIAGPAL
jgi:hypothetical protein